MNDNIIEKFNSIKIYSRINVIFKDGEIGSGYKHDEYISNVVYPFYKRFYIEEYKEFGVFDIKESKKFNLGENVLLNINRIKYNTSRYENELFTDKYKLEDFKNKIGEVVDIDSNPRQEYYISIDFKLNNKIERFHFNDLELISYNDYTADLYKPKMKKIDEKIIKFSDFKKL